MNSPAPDRPPSALSRRSFLLGGTVTVAGLGLGGALVACSSQAPKRQAGSGSVLHTWVGDPRVDGFVVTSRTSGCTSLRLAVSESPDLGSPRFVGAQVPDADGYVRHVASGFDAGSKYYYQLADTQAGGSELALGEIGQARTLHPAGSAVASFTYAAGGALATHSAQAAALDDIRSWDPQLLVVLANLHYHGSMSTDPGVHRANLESQIAGAAGLAELLRGVPTVYNNGYAEAGAVDGDSDTPWERAFNSAFTQVVPARLIDQASPPVAKYRSWSEGRWGFYFMDTRATARSIGSSPDDAKKTMLGADQKADLKRWLTNGSDAVKVIFCGVPWMGPPSLTNDGTDKWWAYSTERQEIAGFIVENQVNVLFVHNALSRLAVDKSHNRWGGFPVVCGSPFDKAGGGDETDATWDSYFNNDGRRCSQYLRLTFADDGHTLSATASGRDALARVQRVTQTMTWRA